MIDTSNLLYSLDDMISGLDFNPTGEYVATIDWRGVCLISDVTTVNYRFYMELLGWGNLTPKIFLSIARRLNN